MNKEQNVQVSDTTEGDLGYLKLVTNKKNKNHGASSRNCGITKCRKINLI